VIDSAQVMTAAEQAAQAISRGEIVVVHDDLDDHGDLVAAAGLTTAAVVTTMVRAAGGLIAVALTSARARRLGLQPVPRRGARSRPDSERTPTMVSVEARNGVSTGISSADRAATARILAARHSAASDLVSPGHVFPLVAAEGGLLTRHGRLEAAVDLTREAGCAPAATICDVLDDAGDLATGPQLLELARGLGLAFVTISELAEARCEEAWGSW
jgi:3,4-dihydroxy 2-butanone 4-phosphate synthase/GTP cyclohydrolase II